MYSEKRVRGARVKLLRQLHKVEYMLIMNNCLAKMGNRRVKFEAFQGGFTIS